MRHGRLLSHRVPLLSSSSPIAIMSFQLLTVTTASDFRKVIECQWAAYENPMQSFFRMFCPLRGEGDRAREESLEESAMRQWEWHTSDPCSHWLKAVDASGTIVGACLWKIHPVNPFDAADDHADADWHPEGGAREYVAQALEQFDAPRRRMGARPQVYLNILYTHPDHRRKGVADLMLAWGVGRADEMGVEMWLDATVYGVPAYKKHGFMVVNENPVRPVRASPSPGPVDGDDAWARAEAELQPMVFWQMWRPAGGAYEQGRTVKPWEAADQ
jgi:GNAT superfamily N-acetyltransferase